MKIFCHLLSTQKFQTSLIEVASVHFYRSCSQRPYIATTLFRFPLQVISLFSNIINCFEIMQFLQAGTYSETCQASQMKRFAKIGSGCYLNRQKEEYLLVLPTYVKLSRFEKLCQQPNVEVFFKFIQVLQDQQKRFSHFRTR